MNGSNTDLMKCILLVLNYLANNNAMILLDDKNISNDISEISKVSGPDHMSTSFHHLNQAKMRRLKGI